MMRNILSVVKVFSSFDIKVQLLFIFAFSLSFRVIYSYIYLSTFGLETGFDPADYIYFAKSILKQGWLVLEINDSNPFVIGPGYPLLIALSHYISSSSPYGFIIAINILLNSLVPVIIYFLGVQIFQNRVIGYISSIWAVFYVHFIRYSPFLAKENIVFFLFPLCILLLLKIKRKQPHPLYFLGWVVSYTFLIHTDERYFFYFPFFIGFLLFPKCRSSDLKNSSILMGGVILLMLPWLYRNYQVYNRPVILTERTTKFTDKMLGYKTPANPYRKEKISSYNRKYLPLYEAKRDSILTGYQVNRRGIKFIEGMEEGVRQGKIPYTYSPAQDFWHDFKEMWRPVQFKGEYIANGYRYRPAWKITSNLIYGLQYGLLLPFFVLGVLKIGSLKNWGTGFFLLLLVGIHTVIHVFLAHGLQRYRVPVDPIIILFAFWGMRNAFSTSIFNKTML